VPNDEGTAHVDEPEETDDLDLRPFDWEKLFRWLFVAGLTLWVVAGALNSVLIAYFWDFFYIDTGDFVTNSEAAGRAVVRISQVSVPAENVAFKVWIAAGALLAFLWLRARTRYVQ
jgi:hypothetical protein